MALKAIWGQKMVHEEDWNPSSSPPPQKTQTQLPISSGPYGIELLWEMYS